MATLLGNSAGWHAGSSQTHQTSHQPCRSCQTKIQLDFSTLSSCSSCPSMMFLPDFSFGMRAAQATLLSGLLVPPALALEAVLYQGAHAGACQSSPVIGQSSFPPSC